MLIFFKFFRQKSYNTRQQGLAVSQNSPECRQLQSGWGHQCTIYYMIEISAFFATFGNQKRRVTGLRKWIVLLK